MKNITIFIFLILSLRNTAQEKRILSFDLLKGTTDTLNIVDFDDAIIRERTDFFVGNQNKEYNFLKDGIPTNNIYLNSHYTKKRQASIDYDINKFPIRTSVKLFKWENDSLKSNCCGSLISRKHVLTACHCIAPIDKNSLLYDSIFVSPAFDNGKFSSLYKGSWVRKIYFFENWDFDTDFSILELEEPIGDNTGWISIGFDSDDKNLLDGIFYKFSYPAKTITYIDTNFYNGDTLYYGYGLVDIINEHTLGIKNTSGIRGESGSSLIKIENENLYTSYGVLSFSGYLSHCRLTNWNYFAIKDIIKNDLLLSNINLEVSEPIAIYPNPTNNWIRISLQSKLNILKISLFNSQGEKVKNISNNSSEIEMNISDLPIGIYIIILESKNTRYTRKVIKTE